LLLESDNFGNLGSEYPRFYRVANIGYFAIVAVEMPWIKPMTLRHVRMLEQILLEEMLKRHGFICRNEN
jgi:hypothetical protein